MTDNDLAGLTRDSCPFCGERVKVGVIDVFPSKQKSIVTCGRCGERSQVAGRSRVGGTVTGIVGAGFGMAISLPNLGSWCIAVATLGYVVFGYLGARLLLRLDPPDLAD